MPVSHDRVKSIFLNAAEIQAPAERQAFVEAQCGADADLRREVEDLLQHHGHVGDFLESPYPPAPQSLGHLLAEQGRRAGPADTSAGDAGGHFPEPVVSEGPGTLIGPYKLLQQIGEGGFGVVFLAEQRQPIHRRVALKIIKPGMDSRQVIARFEAERQALALMDHPNIARVLDAGATQAGRPFFVMELVRGLPITDYCDQHGLPVRQRLGLFFDVCQAIQHAHQKGIIHRDIKPSNVLVTLYDGRPVVKVIDFGIAKALGQELTDKTIFTGFAQLVGTPLYMSPEQAELGGLDIDTRSDIYSLGAVLYELLTGMTPFSKQRLETAGYDEILRVIREEEPARPSTRITTLGEAGVTVAGRRKSDPRGLRHMLRRDLDWIVMKCLEKDRNRRYETANSLAVDVGRYLRDEPVQAGPPSTSYRLKKFLRRNRRAVVAAAVLLLALVGGLVGTTWGLIRATKAEADAVVHATAAQRSEEEAKDQLFQALLHQASALRKSGQAGQRFDSLKALAEAVRIARARQYGEEEFLKLRNGAVACLALPDGRQERVLLEHVPDGYWIAFDPNFRFFVYSDRQGNLSIRRVADGKETARLPGLGVRPQWIDVRFSPDGRRLLRAYLTADRRSQVAIWEFNLGQVGRKVVLEREASLRFSPDSRLAAGSLADGSVVIYEAGSGRIVKRLARDIGVAGGRFHPDGRQLTVVLKADHRVVVVLDLETGKEVKRYEHPQVIGEVEWRGDGRLLAVPCDDQRVYVWDHAKKRLQSVLEGHTSMGLRVKFSHGGEFLISSSWDGTTRLWDPVTGRELVHETGQFLVDIRHEDKQVAVVDREGRLVLGEVTGGWECRTLHHGFVGNRTPRPEHWGPTGVDFSPDGRLLVSSSTDGARLWDLATHRQVGHLPSGETASVLFHPGGTSLFTYGVDGLHRWPIRPVRASGAKGDGSRDSRGPLSSPSRRPPTVLQVGPPESLDVPGNWLWAALSIDRQGRRLAVNDFEKRRAIVLDLEKSANKLVLEQGKLSGCFISPDGRWILTQQVNGNFKIWDAAEGKPASWQPPAGERLSFFSMDGRWLVTSPPGDAPLRFWQLGSWQPGPMLPKYTPKLVGLLPSPDGVLLHNPAWGSPPELIHPGTGKVLAALEPPRDVGLQGANRFSPDGTLLAVPTGNHTIHVWDLRAIRRGLAEIGLDWDRPPYPPAKRTETRPIRVEVLAGKPAPK
jgi:serine/threonine protein kinase/WD40 repeat protein